MAGCLKAGARRAERLRGIKKAGARSGSMPFVSSSPPPPYGHTRDAAYRASACLEARKQRIRARLWIDA